MKRWRESRRIVRVVGEKGVQQEEKAGNQDVGTLVEGEGIIGHRKLSCEA